MAIVGADIWAWRHAGAYGTGTSKTPPKVATFGGVFGVPDPYQLDYKIFIRQPSFMSVPILRQFTLLRVNASL